MSRVNEIDQFRLRVLQEIVEGEQRREREMFKKQRECFHRYQVVPEEETLTHYRVRCGKCDYTPSLRKK